jgi:hypothetical protein
MKAGGVFCPENKVLFSVAVLLASGIWGKLDILYIQTTDYTFSRRKSIKKTASRKKSLTAFLRIFFNDQVTVKEGLLSVLPDRVEIQTR